MGYLCQNGGGGAIIQGLTSLNYVILEEKLLVLVVKISVKVFLVNFGLTNRNFMSFLGWGKGRCWNSLDLHFSGPFKTCKMPGK